MKPRWVYTNREGTLGVGVSFLGGQSDDKGQGAGRWDLRGEGEREVD